MLTVFFLWRRGDGGRNELVGLLIRLVPTIGLGGGSIEAFVLLLLGMGRKGPAGAGVDGGMEGILLCPARRGSWVIACLSTVSK